MDTLLAVSLLLLAVVEVVHIACNLAIVHLNNKIKEQQEITAKMVLDYVEHFHPDLDISEVVTITIPGDKPKWKIYLTLEKAIEAGWQVEYLEDEPNESRKSTLRVL